MVGQTGAGGAADGADACGVTGAIGSTGAFEAPQAAPQAAVGPAGRGPIARGKGPIGGELAVNGPAGIGLAGIGLAGVRPGVIDHGAGAAQGELAGGSGAPPDGVCSGADPRGGSLATGGAVGGTPGGAAAGWFGDPIVSNTLGASARFASRRVRR